MTKQSHDWVDVRLTIDNSSGSLSRLVLEPWAEEIKLSKGDEVDLLASGPADSACIDQEYRGDLLILHAHRGWVFAVSVNGKEVQTGSRGFPSI